MNELILKGYVYPERIVIQGEDFVAYFKDNKEPPWFAFQCVIEVAYGNRYIENIRDHWLMVSANNRAILTLHDNTNLYLISFQGVVEFLHKKIDHNREKTLIRGLRKQVAKILKRMPEPMGDAVSDVVIPNSIGSVLIRSLPVRYVKFNNKTWFRGSDLCKVYYSSSVSTFMLAYDEVQNTEKRMVKIENERCLLLSELGVEQLFQWFDPEDRTTYLSEIKEALAAEERPLEDEPERHGLGLYFTKSPYVVGNVIDWTEFEFESNKDRNVSNPLFVAYIQTETGMQYFFKPSDICKIVGIKNRNSTGISWEYKACFSIKEEDRRRAVLLSAEGIKELLKRTEVKNRAVRYAERLLIVAKRYEQEYKDWFEYRKRKYAAYKEADSVNTKEKMTELLKSGDTVDYVCGAIILAEELRRLLSNYKGNSSDIITGKGLPGPKTKTLIEDLWKFIDTQDHRQKIGYLFQRSVEKAWTRYQAITG